MSEVLLTLRAPVRCRRAPPPLGLTLSGATGAAGAQEVTIAFSAAAPADLPDTLPDVLIESLAPGHYRISSGARAWQLTAPAVHLTRDVAGEFYRALPPRPVPAGKRLFWRAVLALAASRVGLALLRALRR